MSTSIEWTDESWNPIRARLRSDPTVIGWHCEHASPGCEHCYSETRNRSGRCNMGTKLPYKPGHRMDIEVYLDEAQLLKPLSWRKGRKVFPCSMTDLFADFVTDEMLDRVFAVMILSHQHVFQVVTKRSARMRKYLSRHRWHLWAAIGREIDPVRWRNLPPIMGGDCTPVPNVWLGVSVEDQQRADERIPDLLATPAAIRWISAEPLLGPINIIDAMWARDAKDLTATLDWVVAGGESGKHARPMHPDWARSLRDQCAAADVTFFFKQWGESCPLRAELIPVDRRNIGWVAHDGRFKFDCTEVDHRPMIRDDDRYGAGYWKQTVRVGKKRAGRLLDGIEHNGMPGDA